MYIHTHGTEHVEGVIVGCQFSTQNFATNVIAYSWPRTHAQLKVCEVPLQWHIQGGSGYSNTLLSVQLINYLLLIRLTITEARVCNRNIWTPEISVPGTNINSKLGVK